MNGTEKPSECINEERDEWHPGLIPEWDGTMPQDQMCQRPDGFARDNLGTCGNEAQVGVPFAHLDEAAIENESWPPSIEFHYFCEECAAEWEAEDDMLTSYFEACEKLSHNHWLDGGSVYHLSRLMNGEVTIDDMAIERYTEYATWCIEDGELGEAAKIISRLIDAKGGE